MFNRKQRPKSPQWKQEEPVGQQKVRVVVFQQVRRQSAHNSAKEKHTEGPQLVIPERCQVARQRFDQD